MAFGLYLLPTCSGVLTPEEARVWLEESFSAYVYLLEAGFRATKEEAKSFDMLGVDLLTMAAACAKALATQKSVRLERGADPEDSADLARDLAVILGCADRASECTLEEGSGYPEKWRDLLASLAREVANRLATAPKAA